MGANSEGTEGCDARDGGGGAPDVGGGGPEILKNRQMILIS